MEKILLNQLIPYFTLGVSYIAALFFTYYYYYIKEKTLKIYSSYLWFIFTYILCKKYLLIKFDSPLIILIIVEILFWISLLLYIRFLFSAFKILKEDKRLAKIELSIYILIIIDAILFIVTRFYLSESIWVYRLYGLCVSIYVYAIIFMLVNLSNKKIILTAYKLLFIGTFLLHTFNSFSIFLNKESIIFSLSKFSFLCVGLVIEITIFVISLCIKLKNDHLQTIQILNENAQKTKKLLLEEIERQNVCRKVAAEERTKISTEIHDGISNAVAGLKFFVNKKRLESENQIEMELLSRIEKETSTIYIEIREYINKLHYESDNEKYEISNFIESIKEKYKDNIKFDLFINKEKIEQLISFQQRELYFLLIECITNAIKHSEADKISIIIKFNNIDCFFEVTDNGKGFIKENQKKGRGLLSLKNRLNSLDGELSIQSGEFGTSVKGKFPYYTF